MKQVVISVPENKLNFFMELVTSLGFAKVEEDSKKEIVKSLKKGFNDMKLYKQGKLKTSSLNEFLNDL
jgi:hypothetical protein